LQGRRSEQDIPVGESLQTGPTPNGTDAKSKEVFRIAAEVRREREIADSRRWALKQPTYDGRPDDPWGLRFRIPPRSHPGLSDHPRGIRASRMISCLEAELSRPLLNHCKVGLGGFDLQISAQQGQVPVDPGQ